MKRLLFYIIALAIVITVLAFLTRERIIEFEIDPPLLSTNVVYAVGTIPEEEVLEEHFEPKNQTLVKLVKDIEQCECEKHPNGECIGDTENWDVHSISYGSMQWKLPTYRWALEQLGLEIGTDAELIKEMRDMDRAKEIAYRWIEQDFENVHHWTCYKIVDARL